MNTTEGLIFDVQDFATHDGPGVRTLIFLKGCPLHCQWCANPEGQEGRLQLMYSSFTCAACLTCAEACPSGAITAGDNGRPVIDRTLCRVCETGECIDACPERALKCAGTFTSVDELFAQVRRNTRLYRNSGGGLTLSGGEPLAQPEFVRELMARCAEVGLSVGLETCGVFRWDTVSDFIGGFDFIFFDIKGFEEHKHRVATGAGPHGIRDNLRRLADVAAERITISLPIIPGFTDDEQELPAILDLLDELGIDRLRLLPYHELGSGKYTELGLEYRLTGAHLNDPQLVGRLQRTALDRGFECVVSRA